jgi:uncharacterized protein (DUF4415 family)
MIFHRFFESNLFLAPRSDIEAQNPELSPEFEGSAAPPPERVTVTLEMDADILAWLKDQPRDWQTEINAIMRFFMETSNAPVPPPHEFDPFTYDPEADYGPA